MCYYCIMGYVKQKRLCGMRCEMNRHYNRKVFQGKKKKMDSMYFEGWYFKQTTSMGSSISFIPGISYNEEDPHAFVQCIYLDGHGELKAHYFKYGLDAFSYVDEPFTVVIGDNRFGLDYIEVHLEEFDFTIDGTVEFSELEPLEMTMSCPNIMGYFSYIPKMECNHDIISMHHNLMGSVLYGEEMLFFEGGKGYIEKDWGASFPSEYVWIQSNDFGEDKVRLSCSVATIPMKFFSFQGFFCALILGEEHYRFATYNGARILRLITTDQYVDLVIGKDGMKLRIQARIDAVKELASPKFGAMNETIKEGLSGKVKVQLMDKEGYTIYKGDGKNCGIEIEMLPKAQSEC